VGRRSKTSRVGLVHETKAHFAGLGTTRDLREERVMGSRGFKEMSMKAPREDEGALDAPKLSQRTN